MSKKPRTSNLTGETFDALSAAEKERIFREIGRETPQRRLARSRPLDAAQRARWQRIKQKLVPPAPAAGAEDVRVISVGLDAGLLARVDAYAKRAGLSRAELVARALRAVIGSAA